MKTIIACTTMAILFAGLMIGSNTVQAAATWFQCATCHLSTTKVLPTKHVKKSDFSACFTCHGAGRAARALSGKVHSIHLAKGTATPETCLECHPVDAAGNMQITAAGQPVVKKADLPDLVQKMASWLKSDKLAHAHRKKGLSCQACHSSYDEDDSYNEKCIACHGNYDAMIQKTANTKLPRNPHKSHYPTLKCTNCHQSHDVFKDFCATCHGFGFKWSASGLK